MINSFFNFRNIYYYNTTILAKIEKGDTLIEVIFAFVILATIAGFSFTGALQAYKASVFAQNHTQASLFAQYQADGLKTYRDSIEWAKTGPSDPSPTFLDGGAGLPAMKKEYLEPTKDFCMNLNGTIWVVEGSLRNCNNNIKNLVPDLDDPQVTIRLNSDGSTPLERVTAIVTVSWISSNSGQRDSVVHSILLTKEQ